MKIKLLFIAAISISVFSCNDTGNTTTNKEDSTAVTTSPAPAKSLPISLSVADICGDFSNSVENAKEKYKSDILELKGIVKQVNPVQSDGCNYLTFECSSITSIDSTASHVIKVCYKLNPNQEANFKVGDEVTIHTKFRSIENNVILMDEVQVQ